MSCNLDARCRCVLSIRSWNEIKFMAVLGTDALFRSAIAKSMQRNENGEASSTRANLANGEGMQNANHARISSHPTSQARSVAIPLPILFREIANVTLRIKFNRFGFVALKA